MKNKKHKLLKFGSIGLLATVFGLAVVGYASKNNNYQPVKAEENYYYGSISNVSSFLKAIYEEATLPVGSYDLNILTYYDNNYNIHTNKVLFSVLMNETFNGSEIYNDVTNTALYSFDGGDINIIEPYGLTETQLGELYQDQNSYKTINNVNIYQTNTNATIWNLVVTYANTYNFEQAEQPTSQNIGSGIINAIKSGLTLISDLASQFLLGFSTLFWNTATSSLTTFGMFALVMLGIGITFAVIKLVLNVLRSNTGA